MSLDRRLVVFLVLIMGVMIGPALLAQAIETAAPAAAALPEPSANEWGGSLIWAFLSSSSLEWLKRNPQWSLISERTAFGMQRLAGFVVAIAASVGVHYTYDPGAGKLVIEGLTLGWMWTTGVESLRQWCVQEVTYRIAVKNYRKEGQ